MLRVWRYDRDRRGKRTKVPYHPRTGRRAKSNDPATWVTFDQANAASRTGPWEGLTVFLGDLDDGPRCIFLVGVDLDMCRSPVTGKIEPWAEAKVRLLNTYTETSPSGTGLKAFGI